MFSVYRVKFYFINDIQANLDGQTIECDLKTEFRCKSGQCVARSAVNDVTMHCDDQSDEGVENFPCYPEELRCFSLNYDSLSVHNRCIPTHMIRDGTKDCSSNLDETTFLEECFGNSSFLCLDQSKCLPKRFLCDGVQNCIDGSDEIEYCLHPTMYRVNKPNSEVYIATWLSLLGDNGDLEGHVNSSNKEIYIYGKNLISELIFGLKCLSNHLISDYGFRRKVVPRPSRKYSNESNCKHQEDKCFDQSGKFSSFCSSCVDGTIILSSQICDGIFDCKDLSDECSCEDSKTENLCKKLSKDISKENGLSFSQVCDFKIDLFNYLDEKYCSHEILSPYEFDAELVGGPVRKSHKCAKGITALNKTPSLLNMTWMHDDETINSSKTELTTCNLKYECPYRDDECSGECFNVDKFPFCFSFLFPQNTPFSRYGTNQADQFEETDRYIYQGTTVSLILKNEFSKTKPLVSYRNFPNGTSKFVDKINKVSFKIANSAYEICKDNSLKCPWLFLCENNNSKTHELIGIKKVCDFNIDCSDESDEKYCSSETHFNCTRGSPVSIRKEKVGDNELDCSDQSDECEENPFSSDKEMIKNSYLGNFIWIVSISIVVLNSIVIIKNIRKIKRIQSKHSIKFYNLFFIINLASSDILLGLALTFITFKSKQFSGEYCAKNLEWRSSVGCDVVGILTLLSSQTSLLILLLVTSFRLYTVYKPYGSLDIKPHKVYVLVLFCWGLSLVLSLTPVVLKRQFVQKYVISKHIYLKNKKVERLIDPKDLQNIIEKFERFRKIYETNSADDFKEVLILQFDYDDEDNETESLAPSLNIKTIKTFGFYSSSSVCLPDFFSKSFLASRYSAALLSFNLLIIIFICVGYALIFRSIQRKKVEKRSKEKTAQNKKTMFVRVFLVVATDVVCWLPIIIMSFLGLSGYEIPGIAHSVSSIVLLPINSLLNPVLYSKIEVLIYKKLNTLFKRFRRRLLRKR